MDLSWLALNSMLQAKALYHTEKQVIGYLWLSKKNPDTPTKSHWRWAQLQKGQPTPCKTTYAFHLWVRVLATNLLPLTGPGLRLTIQKFQLVWKWAGPPGLPGNGWRSIVPWYGEEGEFKDIL